MAFELLDTTLPAGVSPARLVALYQFDAQATALTDRSGNGHDLTPYGAVVRLGRGACGERLWQNYNNNWLATAAKSGVFNTLGALTVEWVGMIQYYQHNYNMWLWTIGDPTVTSSTLNVVASLRIRDPGVYDLNAVAMHERDSGVNEDAVFDWGLPFVLHYGALTRAADGKTYKYYSDGELLQTAVTTNPPTGGTGNIKITLLGCGSVVGECHGYLSSWRYCKDVEFTPDQIAESYDRIYA